MFVTYGTLGDDLQDQITRYQNALHDIAVAIDMAAKNGQTEAVTQLRAQFTAVRKLVDQLVAQKKAQESPSSLSLGIANIGERLARTVRNYAMLGAVGIGLAIILPPLLASRRRNRR